MLAVQFVFNNSGLMLILCWLYYNREMTRVELINSCIIMEVIKHRFGGRLMDDINLDIDQELYQDFKWNFCWIQGLEPKYLSV